MVKRTHYQTTKEVNFKSEFVGKYLKKSKLLANLLKHYLKNNKTRWKQVYIKFR